MNIDTFRPLGRSTPPMLPIKTSKPVSPLSTLDLVTLGAGSRSAIASHLSVAIQNPTKPVAQPALHAPLVELEGGCVHKHEPVAAIRPEYRLSDKVVPTMYDIAVEIDPASPTFNGRVKISTLNKQASDSIVLHSEKMDIESAVARKNGEEYSATASYDEESQRTTFTFDREIPAGPMELDIAYTGQRRSDLKGVYLASDGKESVIATQGEPAAARSIFPCFDEPDFKAPLKWTITTDPKYTVVANGPLTRSVPLSNGKVQHHFAPTQKPLATYLAAFTIGEYDATEPEIVAGIPTRVLVGKGKLAQAEFASDVTRNILPALSTYFDQPYPFAKLDQVAIPGFDAGAMENVGAIFYRQSLLQVDEATTPVSEKKDVAIVIAHENCHQWFGNLVSPDWWDDLWLNEAFATWHSTKLVDQWKPEWNVWDDFIVQDRAAGMKADALASTHPIYTEVKNPHEATQNFDVITYRKGASILRMVEGYLGEDTFRDGLRSYMKEHAESNATTDDLWKSLDKAAPGSRASDIMKSWVGQEGFPLVRTNLEGNTLSVSQERYFADANSWGSSDQTWMIPMVIRYEDSEGVKTHRALISDKDGKVELPVKGQLKWAYPNAQVTGFYRTEMSGNNLEQLLNNGLDDLSAAEKVNLLADQWEMARAGQAEMGTFLNALQSMAADPSRLVVNAVCDYVTALNGQVDKADRESFAQFANGIMEPHMQRYLGPQTLSGDELETKARVLGLMAGVCKNETAIAHLKDVAAQERTDSGSVDPAMASVAVSTVAAQGDQTTLNELVVAYQQRLAGNASPSTLARYLSAMTGFEKPEVLARVTGMAAGLPQQGDTFSFPQDQMVRSFGQLLANREGQEATWTFMQQNWEAIRSKAGTLSLSNLVESLSALPVEKAAEVKEFFEKNPVPEAARSVDKALETMALKGELLTRVRPQVTAWLADWKVSQA